MANNELIEFWALPSGTDSLEVARQQYALDEEMDLQPVWKLLGLAICVAISAGGWAGLILTFRHFLH